MLTSCRPTRALSLVALLCILSIFLFAAPSGPYSAVHGPVTALRAFHGSLAMFWSIATAASLLVCMQVAHLATRWCLGFSWDMSSCSSRLYLSAKLRC